MALNLFDVEDAWMQGNVLFDETMQEFEEEWNRPLLQTMLAVELFVNRESERPLSWRLGLLAGWP